MSHFILPLAVIFLLGVAQPLAAAAPQSAPTSRQSKPNVIFILVDDMGYADIGSYGAKDIKTPNLDRLAREGVRLTDTYANGPVCTPTRAGFLTGRYQQRVGLEWALLPTDKEAGLPVAETSLARMLKAGGYRTALFGKWHLGFKPEFGPNAHGFDEFFGILGGNVDMYSHRNRLGTPDLYEKTRAVERPGYMTELITDCAVSFVGQKRSDPFFMYVAYNAVHWPFQPPGDPRDIRNAETWLAGTRADYARMLESVDRGVGRVLAELDRRGSAKDTLVIFTNDNGGERLSLNTPLSNRKGTLWEGGIRVPAILRWPGGLPANAVSNLPTMTMDFTASILAATNTLPPAGRLLDGINILPVLQRREPPPERTLFWRIDRANLKQEAARKGRWKYLRDNTKELLFDLHEDVGERHDVGAANPAVLSELRQSFAQWERDVDGIKPAFSIK